jgi:hypothetical protein
MGASAVPEETARNPLADLIGQDSDLIVQGENRRGDVRRDTLKEGRDSYLVNSDVAPCWNLAESRCA